MAIARGAGTEIIRAAFFEDVDGAASTFAIIGEQYHIYTVLSITAHALVIASTGNVFEIGILGYDCEGATTARTIILNKTVMAAGDTFVWNDKFSFTGYEPVDFAAGLDATKQNALADQGSGVAQKLYIKGTEAGDYFNCSVTFIDQNNA